MKKPDVPVDEATRLVALRGLNILDTPAEERLDRITRVAMRHFGVPIALVSLVDADRQWFKSRQGLDALETPRDISFCGHAIISDAVLHIPDALLDERFADNPLVLGGPKIRLYAGAPLHTSGGARVGTLCIIDDKPRTFSDDELSVLRDLAACVEVELEHANLQLSADKSQALEQSSIQLTERLKLATQSAGIGIWDWDLLSNVFTCDDRMFELNGLDRRTCPGALEDWLGAIHHDDRAGCEQAIAAAVQQGIPYDKEFRVVWPDGSAHDVKATGTVMRNTDNVAIRMTGVNYDITERKRVERMKREFISTVSHELRTPLTSIRGALGLVAGGASGVLPEKALDLVNIAKNNCDRLVRLINDILDMEKIESGKMQFTMLPIDAQSLIGEAVDANQAYAYQRQVKIEIAVGADNAEISGDRDRLLQVLTNLLSNASKFSPPGGTVTVSTSAENGELVIRVSDAGPGIPEAFKSRIFQKFSQADSSDTRSKGGTGLGLSISQAIVENHGGQIGFDSTPGKGTCFWVRLPTRRRDNSSEQALGKIRVLVVEDDQDIAKLLKIILERAGYAVDVALSLVQARELLGSINYSAITLDLLLPGESGFAFVRELRDRPETAALPIVVVSAVVESGPKELNGAAVMVLDWLGKPIDEDRLLSAVADAVKKSGGKRRVLHVEDDVDIARVLRAMLEGVAEVDFAPTLNAAHVCLSSVEYAMVILDIGLPDGSGLELLPRLAQQYPSLPVLIFSGQEFDKNEYGHVLASYVKSRSDTEDMVRVIQNHFSQKNE